jgi:hypothetical protein
VKRCYGFFVQPDNDALERPTVTIDRDALLWLIESSAAEPTPLAHTVSRAALRARAVTRDEAAGTHKPLVTWDEPIDTDIRPSLSPWLVAAVLLLLAIAFIAAAHAR